MTEEQGKTRETKAVWSLVLGILSITCLGLIAGVPAIICGHRALTQIRKSAGLLVGEGMAIAGLVMGYFSIVSLIVVVPLMTAIAIPSFVKAREETQKNICRNGQRIVSDAVDQWAMNENANEGDVIDQQDVLQYLRNSELPVCPAGQIPIEIPNRVGEPVTCPAGIESHMLESRW